MTLEDSISASGMWRVVGFGSLCLETESKLLFSLLLYILMVGMKELLH